MAKYFNTEGSCYPDEHYMASLDTRIQRIKVLIDHKKYFQSTADVSTARRPH